MTQSRPSNADQTNRKISAVYFASISFFIVLGNCVTLCVVWKKKRKKPTDHLLGTLAATDLATPICEFVLSVIYATTGVWIGGEASCYLEVLLTLFLLRFSMIVSTLIAIDRCLAVSKPFFYRAKVRLRPVQLTIAVSGLYSILVALLPIAEMASQTQLDQDWWKCAYHWKTNRTASLTRTYIIANSIDSAISVIIVTICNFGVTVYFIQRRKRQNNTIGPNTKSQDSTTTKYIDLRKRRKLKGALKYAKIMALVTLYFPSCVLPTQILILLHHFNITSIRAETACLYQMHTVAISLLCNPICYALVRKQYRQAYWFIVRHPMVLCGVTNSTRVFDFDGENIDGFECREARRNFRMVALATLATARLQQQVINRNNVEHDNEASTRTPTIVTKKVDIPQSTKNKAAKVCHLEKLSECLSSSNLNQRPTINVSPKYFSVEQESLPSSPGYFSGTISPRLRTASCESNDTECLESPTYLNSPQRLSFDCDVFASSPQCLSPQVNSHLLVPKERFLERSRTGSDLSNASTASECFEACSGGNVSPQIASSDDVFDNWLSPIPDKVSFHLPELTNELKPLALRQGTSSDSEAANHEFSKSAVFI